MPRLGHIPAKHQGDLGTFNDGTVHRSRLPKPLDPTTDKLVPGTRFFRARDARRTGSEALYFAPGAKTLAPDLADNDFVIHCLKKNPEFLYRPAKKIRKRRVVDGQGRDVAATDAHYAANGMALKREQAEIVDRIQHGGFVRYGGESEPRKGDDKGSPLAFIDEIGDRSANEDAAVMRVMLQRIARRPKAGMTKDNVGVMDKRLALSCPYIELNPKVFGCFRLDNDWTFDDMDHLDAVLEKKFLDGDIPLKPHVGVAEERTDGKIERPHLMVLLPIGEVVKMDRRRRRAVRNLIQAVGNAWIRALEDIGVDRGGATNSQRIKNPFCPAMKTGIFQQSKFMKLSEMDEFFRKRDPKLLRPLDRDDRQSSIAKAGMQFDDKSNGLFSWAIDRVWRLAFEERQHRTDRYKSWMEDRTKMRWGLTNDVVGQARPHRWNATEKQVFAVVASVARNCAARFKEDMCDAILNRGAMADLLHDGMGTEAKQKLSGPWAAKKHAENKTDAVAEAIRTIEIREGRRVSKSALIAELDADKIAARSTLFKRWDEFRLLADQQSETVDGKKVINNAPTCTEHADGSPANRETALEAVGTPERIVLPVPEAENLSFQADIRPGYDLQSRADDRKQASGPHTKVATIECALVVVGVDAMPGDHKFRLLAKDSVVDVVAGIAETVRSVDVGVPATSEPSLPSEDIDRPVAASQEVEDIVERLLHRLSRLRDAPSNLSLAGKGDSLVTAMPANRMESHDARA